MTRRDVVVDAALTVSLVVLGVALSFTLDLDSSEQLVAVGLVIAHVGPLAVRRRWPVAVLATMAGTALLAPLVGVPVVVLGPAALVAVYTVGARVPPPRSAILVAAAAVGMA